MTRNGRISSLITLGFVLSTTPVLAQGLYVGGGIGNGSFSGSFSDAVSEIGKIDKNSTAWKLFGGFSPSNFLGVEGGYRSFGAVKETIASIPIKSEIKGWDVEGLGLIRIAILDFFGKAGAMFWKQDVSIGGVSSDHSGTDFLWGLGAGVHLGPLGIRAEWETVQMKDDLSAVSLSATLGF